MGHSTTKPRRGMQVNMLDKGITYQVNKAGTKLFVYKIGHNTPFATFERHNGGWLRNHQRYESLSLALNSVAPAV